MLLSLRVLSVNFQLYVVYKKQIEHLAIDIHRTSKAGIYVHVKVFVFVHSFIICI